MRILIAGGGIGGLTAALALTQRGFEVSVYEQAPELHELGAGIAIAPNGSRVLRNLGLQSTMEAVISLPVTRVMRLFSSEKSWSLPNTDNNDRFGSPFWLVHRGDLHQTLARALVDRAPGAIHVGARCLGFEQNAYGVTLLLDNGEQVNGDALIGADGVHSRIRQVLFGEGPATFTGFMAWRGVVPMECLPTRLRQEAFTVWLGPLGQFVTYPMRRGRWLNVAATIERSDWVIESWSEAGTVEECHRDFADWHEDVLAVIRAIDIPYKWALIGRPPLQHCSTGRVTLVGDACHPTLPVLGQGANMAIEDGMVLARCLEAFVDIPEALRRYEAARLSRTSRIVHSAFENAQRMRNSALAIPDQATAFMDRISTPSALMARFDWIYSYDAISVPV
jgi:2-polyprenyl-6-methoxyphenol hydroxylase-like FAD-dependent oxidoreductase